MFAIDAGDAGTIELELTDARTHDPAAPAVDDSGIRSPFTIRLQGPAEPVLAQQIVPLHSDALGPLEIFVVPVGSGPDGTTYEAVFA